MNLFPFRQVIIFIHGKNLVKFLRCEYWKCIWNIFTFSWVIIKYFNTFSFCIYNSIAFCQVFSIQIHLRIFISISGYSKISINCRVASRTTKKLIWFDSRDVCMHNLLKSWYDAIAATSACTTSPRNVCNNTDFTVLISLIGFRHELRAKVVASKILMAALEPALTAWANAWIAAVCHLL